MDAKKRSTILSGASIGVALGAIAGGLIGYYGFQNLPIGLAIGVAVGVVMGSALIKEPATHFTGKLFCFKRPLHTLLIKHRLVPPATAMDTCVFLRYNSSNAG